MWCNFTPLLHTHSNIHTNQAACGYTIKYLKPKPITRCMALWDKTLCTPTPQKFSHKHEGTNKGYMYITHIYPNESILWENGQRIRHYSKQALKH